MQNSHVLYALSKKLPITPCALRVSCLWFLKDNIFWNNCIHINSKYYRSQWTAKWPFFRRFVSDSFVNYKGHICVPRDHNSLQAACEKLQVSVWQFWQLNGFLILLSNRINCTARAVARAQHVAITACDWFSKFSSHSKNTRDLLTCFDIILETESTRQKLNTKTVEAQSLIFSAMENQALLSG